MSRAFIREIDDAPPPLPPERSISAAPNQVTPRGARLIKEKIAALEKELMGVSGGESLPLLRRDLRYWLARQASMQLVTPYESHTVGFGSRVTLRRDGVTSDVTVVGEDEADPAAGLIAWTAPLARVLLGASAGDVVELEAGGRTHFVEVVNVAAGEAASCVRPTSSA